MEDIAGEPLEQIGVDDVVDWLQKQGFPDEVIRSFEGMLITTRLLTVTTSGLALPPIPIP